MLDNDLLYKKIIDNKDQEPSNYLDTIDKKVIESVQGLGECLEGFEWNSSLDITDEFCIDLCLK